ncbi:MAG: N-6 DNA methylase [Neisseria sp.]|nr:N-6 DNA methylase [Neisseria sp.]
MAKSAPNTEKTALEILQDNANHFIKTVSAYHYEMGEAQKFISALCQVYGLDPIHAVEFEYRVKKADRSGINRIDGFFPGLLMIEMKSRGEDLQTAFEQALRYVALLKNEADKPQHILVSDFEYMHLYELDDSKTAAKSAVKFKTYDFVQHVEDLAFISGYEKIITERNETLTIFAADKLADLHDAFREKGYAGDSLRTMLVRLLFCLFGDDTELFIDDDKPFEKLVRDSLENGSDLGDRLQKLFKWLNTDDASRANTARPLMEQYNGFRLQFPYINGKLFAQELDEFIFDGELKRTLLACCDIDWSEISPDIFGTLFQNIMESEDAPSAKKSNKKSQHRRDFGAHYTSVKNIRRAIDPLFLDGLKEELAKIQDNAKKLDDFIKKLHLINVLDPACGCGNFLIVAYRELRQLEMQAMQSLAALSKIQHFPQVDVHQFHGFELDPAACEIATVAMWLTDHQMNRRYAQGYKRIPLTQRADVHCVNALSQDWASLLQRPQDLHYIVGNPPFLGKKEQSAEQKQDMQRIWGDVKGYGVLDYVTCWHRQATNLMKQFPHIKTSFVSTNSITQGEQVAVLWQPLLADGIHLHFAHRTFKWSNEGKGVAAVHCVIIGFGMDKVKNLKLWDYSDNIAGDGKELKRVKNINPYLVDAENVWINKRSKPIFDGMPSMNYGSMPIDEGLLILSEDEYFAVLNEDPKNAELIRPYIGGDEFLNNGKRYCLWLQDVSSERIAESKFATNRVNAVKKYRLSSNRAATNKLAENPHLFGEIRQPTSGEYLLIPKVSSERREFIPIGYLNAETIANGSALIIPNASLYHFGILSSSMHNAFMRTVAGRLESRYQYSNGIVYNNFPFPFVRSANVPSAVGVSQASNETTDGIYTALNPKLDADDIAQHIADIEQAAQAVLNARAEHPNLTLAQLYNPETMPSILAEAHAELDDAVDAAYGYRYSADDAMRVAFLFEVLGGK